MSTIRDVARMAQVSVSTVSHFINETRYVSPELTARIVQAMDKVEYRPNRLARSLRLKKTNIIGLIIPDNTNTFYADLSRGIEDTCFEYGLSLILCNSDGDPEKERKYINILTENMVDGIISVPSIQDSAYLTSMDSSPLVLVDRVVPGLEADCVMVDNELGGYLATKHLTDLGHRSIACVSGPLELTTGKLRMQGYLRALNEAGIEVDESNIKIGNFHYQDGLNKAMELFEHPLPPTAIFACNDVMAVGVIGAAYQAGLRIPDDLSVVGFDDTYLAALTVPPLTTIRQPSYEVGKTAAELLSARIAQPDLEPKEVVLPVLLVERNSTAPIHLN